MDFRLRVQQVHKPIFMSLLSLLFPLHVHLAAKVNKVERVEHNPVELTVEVPRPVVIEKTIEAFAAFATVFVLYSSYLSMFCTCNLHQNVLL